MLVYILPRMLRRLLFFFFPNHKRKANMKRTEKLKKWAYDNQNAIAAVAVAGSWGVALGAFLGTRGTDKLFVEYINYVKGSTNALFEADQLLGGLVEAVKDNNKPVLTAVKTLATDGTTSWSDVSTALSAV